MWLRDEQAILDGDHAVGLEAHDWLYDSPF